MKNLREQKDWKEKINGLVLSSKYTEFYGRLMLGIHLLKDTFLCKSKELITIVRGYPNCKFNRYGFRKGKWKLEDGKIYINYYSECFPKYNSDIEDSKLNSHINCHNDLKPVFNDCVSKINSSEIGKMEIKSAFELNHFQKLSPEEEPKQCDPNFVPKTLEDLYIK